MRATKNSDSLIEQLTNIIDSKEASTDSFYMDKEEPAPKKKSSKKKKSKKKGKKNKKSSSRRNKQKTRNSQQDATQDTLRTQTDDPLESATTLTMSFSSTTAKSGGLPSNPMHLSAVHKKESIVDHINPPTPSQLRNFNKIKFILKIDSLISFLFVFLLSINLLYDMDLVKILLVYPIPAILPSSVLYFYCIHSIREFPTKLQIRGTLTFLVATRALLTFAVTCVSLYFNRLMLRDRRDVDHFLRKIGVVGDIYGISIKKFQYSCLALSSFLFFGSVLCIKCLCGIVSGEAEQQVMIEMERSGGGEQKVVQGSDGLFYTENKLRGM